MTKTRPRKAFNVLAGFVVVTGALSALYVFVNRVALRLELHNDDDSWGILPNQVYLKIVENTPISRSDSE